MVFNTPSYYPERLVPLLGYNVEISKLYRILSSKNCTKKVRKITVTLELRLYRVTLLYSAHFFLIYSQKPQYPRLDLLLKTNI